MRVTSVGGLLRGPQMILGAPTCQLIGSIAQSVELVKNLVIRQSLGFQYAVGVRFGVRQRRLVDLRWVNGKGGCRLLESTCRGNPTGDSDPFPSAVTGTVAAPS